MTRTKRVLLVDDSFDNRDIYRVVLEFSGYEVFEAANGSEGVRLAAEVHPDLILMDLAMPVMDGWQALRILRTVPKLLEIPVVAISAHVLVKDAYADAKRAGFAEYLTKPIEPKRVLEVVRGLIGDAASAGSPP